MFGASRADLQSKRKETSQKCSGLLLAWGRQGRVGPGVRREQLLCVTSFHSCNDTIKSVTMPTSEMRAQRLRNELRFHSWI